MKTLEHLKRQLQLQELYGQNYFAVTLVCKTSAIEGGPTSPPNIEKTSDKAKALQALYARYANCQNCALGSTRQKIVFGVGSLDPLALFVGEGPGYEEDRLGEPFVGKAGQLLDKMMAAIGLNRHNSHIANIVKCHPMKDPLHSELRGNDRPPTATEALACREILDAQIQILQPPVLCALGSSAAKYLLNETAGITRLRGKIFELTLPGSDKKIPVVPTYHPAALLRAPELKRDAWQDLKVLKQIIDDKK